MALDIEAKVLPDDEQVLSIINEVRERVGWEALPQLPSADPTSSCSCVFGRSWVMSICPRGGPDFDEVQPGVDDGVQDVLLCEGEIPEYEQVELISRAAGPNGKLVDAIAEVTGGTIGEDHGRRMVVLPGEHPLMRWMWQFDHKAPMCEHIIDEDVQDPLDYYDTAEGRRWQFASYYFGDE